MGDAHLFERLLSSLMALGSLPVDPDRLNQLDQPSLNAIVLSVHDRMLVPSFSVRCQRTDYRKLAGQREKLAVTYRSFGDSISA